jgi:hypothetical protein
MEPLHLIGSLGNYENGVALDPIYSLNG